MMSVKTASSKKNGIPDYERLFQEGTKTSGGKKMSGIMKLLLKENRGKLVLTFVLTMLQQLPSLMIPLVTAEIINTVTAGGEGVMRKIIFYAIVILILLLPNLPTNVLRVKCSSKMQRTVSAGLRNTLIRKLQHLSITYHNEIESGRIQAKFLRDIEAIEGLNKHLVDGILPVILNLLISVAVAVMKSWKVTVFFIVLIPVNILTYFIT